MILVVSLKKYGKNIFEFIHIFYRYFLEIKTIPKILGLFFVSESIKI
jgi:hypothetical protein